MNVSHAPDFASVNTEVAVRLSTRYLSAVSLKTNLSSLSLLVSTSIRAGTNDLQARVPRGCICNGGSQHGTLWFHVPNPSTRSEFKIFQTSLLTRCFRFSHSFGFTRFSISLSWHLIQLTTSVGSSSVLYIFSSLSSPKCSRHDTEDLLTRLQTCSLTFPQVAQYQKHLWTNLVLELGVHYGHLEVQ